MLLFLCLFVFPLTSAIQKTRNSMFGHFLFASPYDETGVGELWECYKLCYDDKENCASINYDMKNGRCKRMKATHANLPHVLVKLENSVYADIRDGKGCANKPHPLGMEDGSIQNTSITASSHWIEPGHNPHHARLNNQPVGGQHIGAWAAKYNKKGEYLEVDLGQVTWITHVATQGRPKETGSIHWVTEYSVEYSLTGDQWQSYQDGNGVIKVFPGNSDQTTVVKNEFSPVIKARYVRIVVQAWNNSITMRAEFYGCAA